jgi:hypothetical protein
MINVIEEDGVRILDVETYLKTFQKIQIGENLSLKIGKITVDELAQTKALSYQLGERKKELEKEGKELAEKEVYANLIDQMMVVLKKHNPKLERSVLEDLPPAAINGIFKFILSEGMGLEKGRGKEVVAAEKTATTSG